MPKKNEIRWQADHRLLQVRVDGATIHYRGSENLHICIGSDLYTLKNRHRWLFRSNGLEAHEH